jgi:hypothetical protein
MRSIACCRNRTVFSVTCKAGSDPIKRSALRRRSGSAGVRRRPGAARRAVAVVAAAVDEAVQLGSCRAAHRCTCNSCAGTPRAPQIARSAPVWPAAGGDRIRRHCRSDFGARREHLADPACPPREPSSSRRPWRIPRNRATTASCQQTPSSPAFSTTCKAGSDPITRSATASRSRPCLS